MDKKVISESMKMSKCDELVRDIKLLASANKYALAAYYLIKPDMKYFRHKLDDRGLQACFQFVALAEHLLNVNESALPYIMLIGEISDIQEKRGN